MNESEKKYNDYLAEFSSDIQNTKKKSSVDNEIDKFEVFFNYLIFFDNFT